MKKQIKVNERELLRAMKRAASELHGIPSRDGYRLLSGELYPNEYEIRKHFGTWTEAKKAFVSHYPEYAEGTEKEILTAYLKKASFILGENFKRDNYIHLKDFPKVTDIYRVFGTWKNAVEAIS